MPVRSVSEREAGTRVLEEAFMANRAALARFLELRCGNAPDVVEDLLQDMWLKTQQVRGHVERPGPYLYRMAHRLVLDTRRGASRSLEREHAYGLATGQSDGTDGVTPEGSLVAREALHRVESRLRELGPRALRIFTRYRLDGIEQRQIATEMGISLSTVEKDLRRSYAALACLNDDRDEA
jgi:RNA polymerase sigma factor (sigma-70 family)